MAENDMPSGSADDAIKTLFWATDLLVKELPVILAFTTTFSEFGDELRIEGMGDEGRKATKTVEGMALLIGIIQGRLTDLRLLIPEERG